MSKIEQAKAYQGADLETIFFRPMLTGPDANALGIRVMYNMPVPTTLQFWKRSGDILQKYVNRGWDGSTSAEKYQKTINLSRVKAEVGYSAEDYVNLVFENITARADVNFEDLSGTELEAAETALFKEAVAESIRATMWVGDCARADAAGGYNTFDGLLKQISAEAGNSIAKVTIAAGAGTDPDYAENIFKTMWDKAPQVLRELKSQGELAFFVTSDLYSSYEDSLDNVNLEAAYMAKQNGRGGLYFKGIPVVDVQLAEYLPKVADMPATFAILTDRRNLALAVNTADYPGTEVRMWYNPDEMENRQRAVFMAGCDYLLPELLVYATK